MPRRSEVETSVPVKDVMTAPVVKVLKNDDLETVARLMAEQELGSIIVTDSDGHPLGLITERDIVARVAARNFLPKNVKAKEVMSTPLRTISPNADIKDAAEEMHRLGIRRLVVMEKGKMIGIISSRDIVGITPALIEIISEKARITATPLLPIGTEAAGTCERCSQWSDTLQEDEGRFLCEECRLELSSEER